MHIEDDGGRRTQAVADTAMPPRPEVVVLGDSFAAGWGVDDEQVMGWIAQEHLPEVRIRNLSVPGYNNVHALRQLRLLAASDRKPRAAVVVYRFDFLERNVGTLQWLRILEQSTAGIDEGTPSYLRVQWHDNKIQEELVPLTPEGIASAGQRNTAREDQIAAAIAIYAELRKIAEEAGIVLFVALMQHEPDDPVVAALCKSGFACLSIVPPPTEWQTLEPVDFHPGPRTQAYYGKALAAELRRQLPRLMPLP